MRSFAVGLFILALTSAAWAVPSPYQGAHEGQGFVLTVVDNDIDQAWEVISGAATFAPMTQDTTLRAAYANLSVLDSLRSGNSGVGSLTAIYLGTDTGDETGNNNFLQNRNTGTVTLKTAVFDNGFSPRWGAYVTRWNDSDFQLGQRWAVACWAKGLSAGNPGVNAPQIVWSLHESPKQARLQFNATTGYLSGIITDDGNATADTVTTAADLYDAAWHFVVFSCGASDLRLDVDRRTRDTLSIANATNTLNTVDTLTFLGSRGGARDFRGMVDEFYVIEDTTTLDSMRRAYVYDRGTSAPDTALVHLSGIRSTDSTHVWRTLSVPYAAVTTDTTKLRAWEWAWLDTMEHQPLILYRSGTTPRQAKLDSIPAGARHEPVAQAFFGANESPLLESVTFVNYGANAITYELRLYPDVGDSIRFDQQYTVVAPAYIPSGGDAVTVEFPGGLAVQPRGYLAAMALGGAANTKGAVIITGRRRWGR